tara:strand:- start:1208 stop:2194 length:987 start_codon:yes stop_codon:yes gene_type:complete
MEMERNAEDVAKAHQCRLDLNLRGEMGELSWIYAYDWFVENKGQMAETTMINYQTNFNKLSKSGAFVKVKDLNDYQCITNYIDFLKAKGKPSTVALRVGFLKNLCSFLHPLGVFGWNGPLQFAAFPGLGVIKLPQTVELKQVFTKDEIDRIIKVGYATKKHKWLIDMFMFMYYTGRRYQTTIKLKKEDINLKEKTIYFRHDKALHGHDIKRTVILAGGIGDKLLNIVKRAMARSKTDAVFSMALGAPWCITSKYLAELYDSKLYIPAGVDVPKDKVHILRRSSATHQLEAGRSMEQVKHWSGWSSNETLERVYDMRLKTEERTAPEEM